MFGEVKSYIFLYIYKFDINIYNLRITYDYERSTIQYHKTIPRGAKDHDYPRAIHMKNINLKLQLNIQLGEAIANNGTFYDQIMITNKSYILMFREEATSFQSDEVHNLELLMY